MAPGVTVRLTGADGSSPSLEVAPDQSGAFTFSNVPSGWYILSAWMLGSRETVKAVHVEGTGVDAGEMPPPRPVNAPFQGPVPVLSVCEALDIRDSLSGQPAVIVGVFKSGMDETLRLDCGTELLSGSVGWPSAVGLTKVAQPPENLRDLIEQKRQQILASTPPEAPLRPERVMGLYGRFAALGGLSSATCCSSTVQTNLPPARLFGLDEKEMRVLR